MLYTITELDKETPGFLREFAASKEVCRLKRIGMNCGCEYTNLTHFRHIGKYSRYDHSYRVAQLLWHYTHSREETLAGLFHDISTPVFAHVVDFLRGDYLSQEATEEGTAGMILGSAELCRIAEKHQIDLGKTIDYHKYPIADNASPQLSADRLEYSFGNMVNYGFCRADLPEKLFQSIRSAVNENGEPELVFLDEKNALLFAELSMKCSNVYVCDEDRYSMQMLSEILHSAIQDGVITNGDLYTSEPEVIDKLISSSAMRGAWLEYRGYSGVVTGATAEKTGNARMIDAKRRYIDPYVYGCGRVSRLFPHYQKAIDTLINRSFHYAVAAVSG